jgi:hypothetical protein
MIVYSYTFVLRGNPTRPRQLTRCAIANVRYNCLIQRETTSRMIKTSYSVHNDTRRLLMSRSRSANGSRNLSRFKSVASQHVRVKRQGVFAQPRQPVVVEGRREQPLATVPAAVAMAAPISRDIGEFARIYDAPEFDLYDADVDTEHETERVAHRDIGHHGLHGGLGSTDDDSCSAMAVHMSLSSGNESKNKTRDCQWITADQVLEYLLDGATWRLKQSQQRVSVKVQYCRGCN